MNDVDNDTRVLEQLEDQLKEKIKCEHPQCSESAIWIMKRVICCGRERYHCGEHKWGWHADTMLPLHPLRDQNRRWYHLGCTAAFAEHTWTELLMVNTWTRL